MEEEDIWLLCLKGNIDSFEYFYKKYYELLFNYGIKICNDNDLVKDCIQNLFVKLINNYQNLSSTESVKFYLIKSFRNTLLNTLKSEALRKYKFRFYPNELLIEKESLSSLSTEILSNKENQSLLKAYNSLPSRQKEIIYLYYIKELSHDEIADLFNINHQSSKNLLFRALTKMRSLLVEQESKKNKVKI
ncbi:MAG: sigma-70 family RNA polymerase sigma factor [Bacteroidales bacterium]|nr:sigma-70 family RNA polymerase sigma factor [Bacteroidales bacterium]